MPAVWHHDCIPTDDLQKHICRTAVISGRLQYQNPPCPNRSCLRDAASHKCSCSSCTFSIQGIIQTMGGLFCISAVPGYALRSHLFLGVILQDVAFFCAYADTGPEYIRSRPHPASNTPQMSLKHAKYALIMVIVTSKYTRYGAVWEQNGSKTGQFTPFGTLDSKKVRFLSI